jgi:hypothetical protein
MLSYSNDDDYNVFLALYERRYTVESCPYTATFIAGSGGNDTCKCHKWSYMTYLAHVYLVSILSVL